MHIQVGEILVQEVGYQKTFKVADEQPELDDVVLAAPVSGSVDIMRVPEGVGVDGRFETSQYLECHRCLQQFEFGQKVHFRAGFSSQPKDELLPIARDLTIDLAPLLREEIILGTPLQQLCKEDCRGIDPETGQAYETIINKETHGSTKETQNQRG